MAVKQNFPYKIIIINKGKPELGDSTSDLALMLVMANTAVLLLITFLSPHVHAFSTNQKRLLRTFTDDVTSHNLVKQALSMT